MSAEYDATEFVDTDFQEHKALGSPAASHSSNPSPRAPTREEIGLRATETQKKLAELKRAQEELERERASLEDTRRRQTEFQNGRQEMITHLTRGLGLLEQAEFAVRRDAEQMAKTLAEFRTALANVQAIREETWTQEGFNAELTRALTTIENARMEWNSARLKFPVLAGAAPVGESEAHAERTKVDSIFAGQSFGALCRLGLALTWPLAVVALLALAVLVVKLMWR